MKKFFSAVLAIVMMASMAATAFALDFETDNDEDKILPGQKFRISTSEFLDKDGNTPGQLDKEVHTISTSWKKGNSYIDRTYFEDGDDFITVVVKSGLNLTSDATITGTLKIRYRGPNDKTTTVYTLSIKEGDLYITSVDNEGKSNMVRVGEKEFSLPYDYMEKKVRFITDDDEDKERYGTFTGEFVNSSGTDVAKYVVKVVDQAPLYLAFNESGNSTLLKKYPNADLRFVSWSATPTFDLEGKLYIYMDPDEYIYGVNKDNTLYRLGGSYDSSEGAYVIKTKTLGSYIVSDKQLVNTGSQTSSAAPASSSTAPKPSSSTPPPAPSSSSAAPAPSSVPETSAESVPEPEPEPEPEPVPETSSSQPEPESKPTDADADKEKGGFPWVPVLIVALVIVAVVCGVILMGNKGSHGKGRRKHFDDWDD